MSKLIGKTYPQDIVIEVDKIKEVRVSDDRVNLFIIFKDCTTVKVKSLTSY